MTLTIEQAINLIAEWHGKTILIEPVSGGITNQTFKVIVDKKPYIVSIAGNTSHLLGINRVHKFNNNKICEKNGLSPKVIHFLESEGVLISEFISFPILSIKKLHQSEVQERLIRILKKLHSGNDFYKEFDMFCLIKHYQEIVREKEIKLPADYENYQPQINTIGTVLNSYRTELVPCHNDLTPENILYDGQEMFIIDFDYSGQNDPCFELANLCIEAKFNDTMTKNLVRAYYGHDSREIISRVYLHGILCDVGWSLWAFIQARIANADFDFKSYGLKRWKKAVKKLETGEYVRYLRYI
ncbi:phosphotransferase [Desulfobacterales bacterium HSG17]|nr:phosphotransferase [Desulfobacterales bacterium HSG17]